MQRTNFGRNILLTHRTSYAPTDEEGVVAPESTLSLERASDLALILAYVVSVCLYIRILATFVLGGLDMDTELNEQLLTTAVIATIVAIGATKGLDELEVIEKWALYITMGIILSLFLGFAHYDWTA